MLGYRRTKSGKLEIVPEEAEIVKMIFLYYLSSMGKLAIAKKLNEQQICTVRGCAWTTEDVRRTLRNEKYTGNLLLQKSFRENHITKKKVANIGQLPQYFVAGSHEAIISQEQFDAVRKQMAERQKKYAGSCTTNRYPFTQKIRCACCGKYYRRKTTVTGVVWICSTYNTKGKKYCPTAKQIPENTLLSACCDVLEISEFDAEQFAERIEQIQIPAPNELQFCFSDGTEQTVSWKDRSRSESWTAEMREKARQKKWRQS